MKILMVGTKPPPYHGQSIAFMSALEAIDDKKMLVTTSFRRQTYFESFYVFVSYFLRIIWARLVFKPDVVYFLCSRSYIGLIRDVWLLSLFYKSPALICNHLHGSNFKEFFYSLPWLIRKIVEKLYIRVDKHAVLIEGMEEQINFIRKDIKIEVIPNFFSDIPKLFNNDRDYRQPIISIIFLSSIMKTKGIFDLINSVDNLIYEGYKIKLTIAGGFVGDSEINEKSVKELFFEVINNKEYIDYVGIVDTEKKYQLLSKNHIFVLPSYYISEAVPLSIIEAMRMGCCIITTNYKYLPLLIKDKVNGIIVNIKSASEISAAIKTFFDNRTYLEAISKYNIIEAQNRYSETTYKNSLKKFIGVN